jgi:RNA polymerase sigma-70 factor (ECF subfamily)
MASAVLHFAAFLPSDRKAIAAGLRRRDPDLLDWLITQHEYRLYRYLLYLTGQRETAEDVFQETWVRVLDRGHQYDGRSDFGTWLFRIARNLVIDLQRRKSAEPLDEVAEPAADTPTAADAVIGDEQRAHLDRAIGEIPAVFREVLVLRFHEEMPLEAIAAFLDIPLPTVKSRLYRGLDALRTSFSGGGK